MIFAQLIKIVQLIQFIYDQTMIITNYNTIQHLTLNLATQNILFIDLSIDKHNLFSFLELICF